MGSLDQNMFGLISLILGAIGIFVSIVVTIKNLIRIELKVNYTNIREVNKLSDANRNIIVSYNDNVVERVTSTQIRIWNNGKKPIKREDIPPNDKLKIRLYDPKGKNINILDYSIIRKTKNNFNINIKPVLNSSALELDFDYLDYRDGVFIEIQHDGSNDAKVILDGVILGPKKKTQIVQGPLYETRDPKQLSRKKKSVFWGILLFIAIPLILLSILLTPWSFQSTASIVITNKNIKKIITEYKKDYY